MQVEARPVNMMQRRACYFIFRGLLILLAAVLFWRMILIIRNSDVSELPIQTGPKINPVLVEVFYESMCPDSKYFIKHQLVPTVGKISSIMDFRLIPYGKANTLENSTGIYFTCQHLERECQGNKIHACAVQHVESQSKLLSYTSCLFDNIRNPQAVGESCANDLSIDWETIETCSNGEEGSTLLKMHGEETHSLDPSVTFIPTILLNKSQNSQKDILKNLLKEVCAVYSGTKPSACP